MSESDANAYKARAEGKAALITAWMPVIRLVTGFLLVSFTIAVLGPLGLGVIDSKHIQLITELYSAIKP